MGHTGRDDPGSASEKRSEKHAADPFEGCAEWFEKMRERLESGGGELDCCAVMRGKRRAERESEKGDA